MEDPLKWGEDVKSIVLVTRRTKKMNWRRHKKWLRDRLMEAEPMNPALRAWMWPIVWERAKFLREWYC